MSKEKLIENTLTSFFYDLVKEVPVGTLNNILCNIILKNKKGAVASIVCCDHELECWAREFALQLMRYETKFTRKQLDLMGFSNTVAKGECV